jgi:hypothetical protein
MPYATVPLSNNLPTAAAALATRTFACSESSTNEYPGFAAATTTTCSMVRLAPSMTHFAVIQRKAAIASASEVISASCRRDSR